MERNFNDFLKYAYEHGKVKDVSEAFKEYDPNEEWHQGKKELVLKEVIKRMV